VEEDKESDDDEEEEEIPMPPTTEEDDLIMDEEFYLQDPIEDEFNEEASVQEINESKRSLYDMQNRMSEFGEEE
jgi:hypothetical protein